MPIVHQPVEDDALFEPDPAVVRAARAGDSSAFEELVRAYQADVWRLCLHLVRNEALADDVTQDAFVRAFRFLKRYRGESKFSTWLFSIAHNCAVDEIRRAGRRRRTQELLHAQRPAEPQDPAASMEIRYAIESLPIDLRAPMLLIDIFGLPYREAGRILKLPEGTVKSRVHRARVSVAEMLEPKQKRANDEI
ncbi:MAG TPA: sigma-70 family RNA polymerase sigma factor [Actinomycetota bacterium]|nr:sigma-70 family RNA polymerase sigma factor [Actinomycetota bacterium]